MRKNSTILETDKYRFTLANHEFAANLLGDKTFMAKDCRQDKSSDFKPDEKNERTLYEETFEKSILDSQEMTQHDYGN